MQLLKEQPGLRLRQLSWKMCDKTLTPWRSPRSVCRVPALSRTTCHPPSRRGVCLFYDLLESQERQVSELDFHKRREEAFDPMSFFLYSSVAKALQQTSTTTHLIFICPDDTFGWTQASSFPGKKSGRFPFLGRFEGIWATLCFFSLSSFQTFNDNI